MKVVQDICHVNLMKVVPQTYVVYTHLMNLVCCSRHMSCEPNACCSRRMSCEPYECYSTDMCRVNIMKVVPKTSVECLLYYEGCYTYYMSCIPNEGCSTDICMSCGPNECVSSDMCPVDLIKGNSHTCVVCS